MKFLSDIVKDKQTALFEKTGAFFAYSMAQVDEGRNGVPNEDLIQLGAGLICPKVNKEELKEGLKAINDWGIEEDMKQGKVNVILRELGNYECWFLGDPSECFDALEEYPITKEEIVQVFHYRKL